MKRYRSIKMGPVVAGDSGGDFSLPEPVDHTKDSDCKVDPQTNLCTECGALHGEPCYHCGARAYHRNGCAYLFGDPSRKVKKLQRKDAPKFVAVDRTIMRGSEHIATACSYNMAQRIARALNLHKPNSRGI